MLGNLLELHLRGTIFINWFGRFSLLQEKQSLAGKLFSVGQKGALKLLSKKMNYNNWIFPNIMTERGFPENESDGLQNFFYRSDGFRLWNILHRYVSSTVYKAYSSDIAVLQDNHLHYKPTWCPYVCVISPLKVCMKKKTSILPRSKLKVFCE